MGLSLNITSLRSYSTFFLKGFPVYAFPHTSHGYPHINFHLLFLITNPHKNLGGGDSKGCSMICNTNGCWYHHKISLGY